MRSLSNQACPKRSLEYPVFGARPFTVSVATAARALPLAAAVTGATVDFAGDGVGVGVGVAVAVGVGVGDALCVVRVGEGEEVDDEVGPAVGACSVGAAVAAPTRVSAIAIPNAPTAVALLRRRAHPTRPRMRAMTPTTNT